MRKFLQIVLTATALLAGLGSVRAQDNLDYFWVQDSGNWFDLTKWQVKQPDGSFAPAAELPDATNRVFINSTEAPDGSMPLSISQSALPNTVDITIGGSIEDYPNVGPVSVKSIRFEGTIPSGTVVNFTTSQPLIIAEDLTLGYPVSITANSTLQTGSLAVNAPAAALKVETAGSLQTGALTFSTEATDASLLAHGPVSVTGAVIVNARTSITANNSFSTGSLTYNSTSTGTSTLTLGSPAVAGTSASLGTVIVSSPVTIVANNTGNNTLSMASLTFGNPVNGASASLTTSRPTTIGSTTVPGSVMVNGPATITANNSLVVNGAMTVNALANITTASTGSLQVNSLTFGTGASTATTNSTLTANGTVTVSGAVQVSARTNISTTAAFSAQSVSFNAGSANSTVSFGQLTTITNALTVSDAINLTASNTLRAASVAINAPATTTITASGRLETGSISFSAGSSTATESPSLIAHGPVSVTGAVIVNAKTSITANNSFSTGSLTYNSTNTGTSTFKFGDPSAAAGTSASLGTVIVNAPLATTVNNTLTMNSLGYGALAGGSNLTVNQSTTVLNNVSVGSAVTLAANGLLDVKGAMTVSARSAITVANTGELKLGSLSFGTNAGPPSSTAANSTLIAEGPVRVTSAITSSVPTAITVNGDFTASSIAYTGLANNSTLRFGDPTAVTGTSATISGAVTAEVPVAITSNNRLTVNSISFTGGATGSSLTVNQSTTATIRTGLTVGAATTIAANGLLDVQGAMTATARATVTVANTGELKLGSLDFGRVAGSTTLTASGSTLTAEGRVTVTNAVTTSVPTTIVANGDFSAGSIAYNNGVAGTSTLTFGRLNNNPASTATIRDAIMLNVPVTMTVNNAVQAGSLAVNATSPITVARSGSLQVNSVNYGTLAGPPASSASGSTLTGEGTLALGAVSVSVPTTITANNTFTAASMIYNGGATGSALRFGEPAAVPGTSASISGAVTVNAPVTITANNTGNNTLSMGSLTFGNPVGGTAATLITSRPTTIGSTTVPGSVLVNGPANITANSSLVVYGGMTVNALANITTASTGSLQVNSLAFGTGASTATTNSTLTANGTVTVSGAVQVSAPRTNISTTAAFSAQSVSFNAGSLNSTVSFGQLTTITNALTVSDAINLTASNTLRAASVAINAPATTTITASGRLETGSISFGTRSTTTPATLTANGPVVVNGAVQVSAPANITVNQTFQANSLTYNSAAGASTFIVGQTSPTVVRDASATILGPVSVASDAIITANNGNSLSITGALTMTNASARLNINGAVSLGGSLSVQTPLNLAGTTGSFNFNSSNTDNTIGTQTSNGATDPGVTFEVPITFSGGGRWTLQTNLTAKRQVNFVKGYLIAPTYETRVRNNSTEVTSSKILILDGTAAVPNGASNDSHVIGYVQKKAVTTSIVMPIGAGPGMYRPVTTAMSSSNDVTARYYNANPGSHSPVAMPTSYILPFPNTNVPQMASVSNREYWYITSNDNSGLRVNLNYNRPNITGENPLADLYYFMNDPARRASLTVAGWKKNGGWADINVGKLTTIDPIGKTVESAGSLNQSEYFTIAARGNSSLPVHLVSFSAQYVDGQVQLKWQSSAEENTSHFEVEKSADGKHFTKVLSKKAQGSSASLVSYNAIDNSPYSGTSYYRLKMVDLDGTFEYSKLAVVSAEATLVVRGYPNPSKGNSINFMASNGSKLVLKSVSDLFGKQIGYHQSEGTAEGLQVSFPQPLPAGFYVATLLDSDNGQLVKVKFVVQ